jgi:hypothetical protein
MDPIRVADQLVGVARVPAAPVRGVNCHSGLLGITEQAGNLMGCA